MPDQPGWGITAAVLLVALAIWRSVRWCKERRALRRRAMPSVAILDDSLTTLFEAAVFHFERFDRDCDGRITTNDLWYAV
jgi:hypothetical protein